MKPTTQEQLLLELEDLRARLDEAEETLRAICSGEVDALIVSGVDGEQVFTLKGADHTYRVLIEDMNEGALTLTADGVILYANRRFAAMLKTPLEKVIGSAIHTWIAPDSQRILQSLLRKGVDEIRREQLELTAGDGTLVPVYLSVSNLPINEMPDSFCLVATDLTEQKRSDAIAASEKLARELLAASSLSRLELLSVIEDQKRAEEALRESREKFHSMVDNIGMGVALISPTMEILELNHQMRVWFPGIDPSMRPICYRAFNNPPRDEICDYCPMYRTLQDGKVHEGATVKPMAGRPRNYRIVSSPIFNAQGRLTAAIEIVDDITERVALEAQFRQSQKMEAIGILAGGVAHDFNNILTTIIGNAHLALMEVDKDGPLREVIDDIRVSGEQAASLTSQLLAFSRKQIIQPKILDLNELLTDIEKMLSRLIREDIELLMIPGPELWQVKADPGQMEQIIMNLAINAKDAMPTGGKLTIETANMDLDENYFLKHGVREKQPGFYVMLTVSDTGIGMDKATEEHIFEPFFTTKEIGKGTGLGLSTVYGIIKQNNGFIRVYSEPGQGSTFKVYLPKAQEDAEPIEEKPTPVSKLGGSETILIVEDDNSLRKLARTVLKHKGYKVLEAENGEDALRVAEAYDGSIDLMITDVVMPKMGGKEVAERLQPLYPQMKVIYMSGYTDNAISHHGVLAPGLDFLEKPFSPKEFARKVRETLDTA